MEKLIDYIEKTLNESIFDDEDTFLDPGRDKKIVESWIKENYEFDEGLKISDNFIVDCDGSVVVENLNITSFTNGLFRWGKVSGYFDCSECKNLKYLEGAPTEVNYSFVCSVCDKLSSLEGAPERVGGSFDCKGCKKLKSLEGGPKRVGGNFNCSGCENLRSL